MFCVHCGVSLPGTARFCNRCGKPVSAGPAGFKCPGCGETISSRESPCPNCGPNPVPDQGAQQPFDTAGSPRDHVSAEAAEHFESSRQRARNTNLIAVAVGLLFVPFLLYYVKDERDPRVLGIVTVIGGALALVTLAFTRYLKGAPVIDISPEGIRVRNRGKDREMKWAELKHVHHSYLGGGWWHLTPVSSRKMSIPLDGFTDDQQKRIGEIIQAYYQKSRQC